MEGRPSAKVNLTLEILGRRPDGYHELSSFFLRVGLCDRLTIEPGEGPSDRLTVTGLPGAPVTGNLVLRAFEVLRTYVGIDLPALDVTLDKGIPAAAGLGGGSSDAAMALRMAQLAWGVRVARSDELGLAESLGSDVPFFYFDMPAAHVSGRGQQLSPLGGPGDLGIVLVHPPVELSTAQVFARYDELSIVPLLPDGDSPYSVPTIKRAHSADALDDLFLDQIQADEVVEWADSASEPNDLWPAAASLEPLLPRLRSELEASTGKRWLMSGSGPTLFAIYPSVAEAADAGRLLVAGRSAELADAQISAVDLVGPDPAWRYS